MPVRLLKSEIRQSLLLRSRPQGDGAEAGKILLAHGRGILHQIERAGKELGQIPRVVLATARRVC